MELEQEVTATPSHADCRERNRLIRSCLNHSVDVKNYINPAKIKSQDISVQVLLISSAALNVPGRLDEGLRAKPDHEAFRFQMFKRSWTIGIALGLLEMTITQNLEMLKSQCLIICRSHNTSN